MVSVLTAVTLAVCHTGLASADSRGEAPVPTPDNSTVVDLTATDLQQKKNLLDCNLRLEGNPPNYRLVYGLGTIPIPEATVVKKFGKSHALINIAAHIGSVKVRQLFVRVHADEPRRYGLTISCRKGTRQCVAPVAYGLILDGAEDESMAGLQSVVPRALLSSGKYDKGSEANPGAILVFDRPGLFSPAMEGHSGSKVKSSTNMYFVCGTSTEYWD